MAISISNAANEFVRVLLSDAGKLAGGLKPEQRKQTLEFFENCCAYTGVPLNRDNKAWDHAIPINRHYCGLHLYGNLVPATKRANEAKSSKHFQEFVDDPERLQKIKEFMAKAGYYERAKPFQGLQAYCQTQYNFIVALRNTNADYLKMLLPKDKHAHEQMGVDSVCERPADPRPSRRSKGATRDMIVDLMQVADEDRRGLSYCKIADCVREQVPGAKTTARSVANYKQYAKKLTHGISQAEANAILAIKTRA